MNNGQRQGLFRGRWTNPRVYRDRRAFERHQSGLYVPKCDILELPDFNNGITNEGIHYALEVVLRGDAMTPVAQSAPWFGGLIDNSGFSGVAAADVANSHAGWVESDDYSESDRPTLPFAAASSRQCIATVSWTMNATKTIAGIFIIDDDTKNGTTGVLFSTALFSAPPSLTSGNVLTANYALTD